MPMLQAVASKCVKGQIICHLFAHEGILNVELGQYSKIIEPESIRPNKADIV